MASREGENLRDKARVLVVSASAGMGHLRAAAAVEVAFRELGVAAEHVDILELAPRWVQAVYGGGFEFMASHAPWLWREVYERTDGPECSASRWGELARRTLFREFSRLLGSGEWRYVLCTHFLPGQLISGRSGFPPFGAVVTDFTLHRYWVQEGVGRYFVATEGVAAELRARAPWAGVTASGIPIAPAFGAAGRAAVSREALGLDPTRRVVLVVGGGMGLGIEETVRAALDAAVPGVQVVAVCGRNEGARARLAELGESPERLQVHGFVQGLERYLAISDLVVTKPGGLTTSEALALGRPLLLTRPIPGQEEGNVRELTGAGAALSVPEPAAVRRALEWIDAEPEVLESLSRNAARIGRPDAALRVAEAVRREYLMPEVGVVA